MSGPARILATLFGVAAIAIAAVLLLSGSDKYTAKVEMPNAYGVRKNSSVKIAGANGGKIKETEVERVNGKDIAVITMEFKDDAKPIGTDAKVTVRPTDLLGERYIALTPGDLKGKPAPDGFTIRTTAVDAPVELDNIVNTFGPDVRARMRILINEFGVAMQGRGADLNGLLGELPTSLDKAEELTKQVAAENENLEQLVRRGDSLLSTVNTKKEDFGRLIREADQALTMVSDNRENLGATVRSAPAALSALSGTLRDLDSASVSLKPAADSLRRAAEPLSDTMKNIPGFQQAAEGTLRAATEASPALTRLGKGTTSPVKALRPAAADFRQLLGDAQPTVDTLERRGTKDFLWLLQGFSRWFRPRDELTHQVQANVFLSEEYLESALSTFLDDNSAPKPADTRGKKKAEKKPEPRSEAPAQGPAEKPKPKVNLPELPVLKDLPKTLKDTTKKVQELPKKVTEALPKVGKGVRETLGGVGQKLGGQKDQQRKESSDAMGLFDYLFAP